MLRATGHFFVKADRRPLQKTLKNGCRGTILLTYLFKQLNTKR